MPYYMVTVTASVAMLIQADTEAEATDFAYADVDFGFAGHKETSVPVLVADEPDALEQARRHAEQVSED